MVRIVWVGCHEEGVEAFRQTLEDGGEVCAFITLDDAAFGKRSAGSRAYEALCRAHGVPYETVHTIKGDDACALIEKYRPDLLVVLGWSEILPARLLKIPTIGAVGAHASPLPHGRGSAPINWALIRGERETGNTLMWLSEQVDAGEIVDQVRFPITPYDTCKTLYDRVAEANAVMLRRLLAKLEAGERPSYPARNLTDEPILPRRHPQDGLIDWNQSGEAIYDFIRALTRPYPGAFTFLNGKKLLIWKASLLPVSAGVGPGEIAGNAVGFDEAACGLVVGTRTGALLVAEIEDEAGTCYAGRALCELSLKGGFSHE